MNWDCMHFGTPRRVRIHDGGETLRLVRRVGIARPVMRRHVEELAAVLAEHTRQIVRHHASYGTPVLCVFVLRGGALLYPAFSARFADADVCFLGMHRTPGGVVCEYATPVPRDDYEAVVIADCVIGTGDTMRTARDYLDTPPGTREYIATLCASKEATTSLITKGLTVIGLALDEELNDGLVLPDLGHLDAGDLFSQA